MTTTPTAPAPGPAPLPAPDSPAQVLAWVRETQDHLDRLEVDKLLLALSWAAMHSTDTLVPAFDHLMADGTAGGEQPCHLAGQGAPAVAEFCVAELAAVLSMSTDAGAAYLGEAVELRYRLPRTYARVVAGDLPVWRARRIARATRHLPPAGAGFVDTHVAPVAAGIGPAALDRLTTEALVRADPAAAEARRRDAVGSRCFDVATDQVSHDATVTVHAVLDLADALDLDDALARRARLLGQLGSVEPLPVRRALAAGDLARADLALDLTTETDLPAPTRSTGPTGPTGPTRRITSPARQVVVYVHLSDAATHHPTIDTALDPGAALDPDPDTGRRRRNRRRARRRRGLALARVERTRTPAAIDQVRAWCQAAGTTVVVKPVMDLATDPHVSSYEIPDRIREHVRLRDPHCVFPWCTRPARHADLDHTERWTGTPGEPGTRPSNLAPLCRRHHRHKTHGRWRYHSPAPGTYHWTSPHGHHFTVHRGHTTHHEPDHDPTGPPNPTAD